MPSAAVKKPSLRDRIRERRARSAAHNVGPDDQQLGAELRRMRGRGPLIYRQALITRLTHWIWAIALFFLLLSGLQIFNAHPTLYIGDQSGFAFDNSVLSMGAANTPQGPRGILTVFGQTFDTTGVLGLSGPENQLENRGFPAWATIPSHRDLGTGRVVHFFFAWVFAGTLLVWLLASLFSGHLRELFPRGRDLKALPRDVVSHLRFRFSHAQTYGPLQKLSYAAILFVVFPLIILTGLAMSPTMNAAAPLLVDLLGGRQTARTLHFVMMLLLVIFFVVHVLMVVLAGPINELRSMITGWYRADADPDAPAETVETR